MNTARQGPTDRPPRLRVGDLTVTVLDGGPLWLDGGAMFGIIPKPIWSSLTEVDEDNRIPLAATCFLLESGGRRVLLETGVGDASKYSRKEQGFFRLGDFWLLDSLAAAGVERESIDIVILTHLHFDHAGGGTMPNGRGDCEVTFPNAQYVVQRGEWEDAASGYSVMSSTYRRENLAPLERAGVLSLVDGDAEVTDGVSVSVLRGHTRHQQGVVLESAGQRAVLTADLMPTSAHVGLRHNMGYDLLPYENMLNKKKLLKRAAEGGWFLLLGQDPCQVAWRVEEGERGRHTLVSPVDLR